MSHIRHRHTVRKRHTNHRRRRRAINTTQKHGGIAWLGFKSASPTQIMSQPTTNTIPTEVVGSLAFPADNVVEFLSDYLGKPAVSQCLAAFMRIGSDRTKTSAQVALEQWPYLVQMINMLLDDHYDTVIAIIKYAVAAATKNPANPAQALMDYIHQQTYFYQNVATTPPPDQPKRVLSSKQSIGLLKLVHYGLAYLQITDKMGVVNDKLAKLAKLPSYTISMITDRLKESNRRSDLLTIMYESIYASLQTNASGITPNTADSGWIDTTIGKWSKYKDTIKIGYRALNT
jgi:hypothetical protein